MVGGSIFYYRLDLFVLRLTTALQNLLMVLLHDSNVSVCRDLHKNTGFHYFAAFDAFVNQL